jgi:hypothetical protein
MDKEAHTLLGFKTFSQASREIGATLNVKPNTLKNMRDEFDYHLENSRVGWKRELRGSRLKALQAFEMTSDNELLEIVKEILANSGWRYTNGLRGIHGLLLEDDRVSQDKRNFILRGPTGKRAENYYMDMFKIKPFPSSGELTDCREMGCGYDFEVGAVNGKKVYVEIKGLASNDGGILFTDKEWQTAKKHTDSYYLIIVKNVSNQPITQTIQDPANKLDPKKNIHTTIQVSWSVTSKGLVV